jgi:hypothetical protein
MVDFDDPHQEVQMRGRVVERRPDPELSHFDVMSLKYVGKPWPYRDEESPIVLIIEVTKVRYSPGTPHAARYPAYLKLSSVCSPPTAAAPSP